MLYGLHMIAARTENRFGLLLAGDFAGQLLDYLLDQYKALSHLGNFSKARQQYDLPSHDASGIGLQPAKTTNRDQRTVSLHFKANYGLRTWAEHVDKAAIAAFAGVGGAGANAGFASTAIEQGQVPIVIDVIAGDRFAASIGAIGEFAILADHDPAGGRLTSGHGGADQL